MRAGAGRKIWDVVLAWTALGVLLFALGLDVYFWPGILETISTDSVRAHGDFNTFWHSAAALWEGEDIYDTGAEAENRNPPFWTVLISPLGLLEPPLAYGIFTVVSVIVTVGYLTMMASEVRLDPRWAVPGTTLLLLSSPLLKTLALGQIYPVLATGLVVAWISDRQGRVVASGSALGLVVAVKPSLAPIVLWPLVRRRWKPFAVALLAAAVATLVGVIVAGPGATLDWLRLLSDDSVNPFWDNASLSSAAARLFTDNEVARPIATLPWMVPVAYVLGIVTILFTAARVRQGPEVGLWALVAASLLASPIAWHNYLVLLGPGILLLLARGWIAPGFLLLTLQAIPPYWPALWAGKETALATLALTLYFYILVAHWIIFAVAARRRPAGGPESGTSLQTRAPLRDPSP
jgi:alpha-1,2-mannosyltransferase/arabinofuranan 3-O-arabinosyltransferase